MTTGFMDAHEGIGTLPNIWTLECAWPTPTISLTLFPTALFPNDTFLAYISISSGQGPTKTGPTKSGDSSGRAPVTTFDRILPSIADILGTFFARLPALAPFLLKRDLNGRVRLIVPVSLRSNDASMALLRSVCHSMTSALGPHAARENILLHFEEDVGDVIGGAPVFPLEGVRVVDRLVTETPWTAIAPESSGTPRIVFFSITGGVGRSTAVAVSALNLAQSGKRIPVLVLDLDLESRGLSGSLLPEDRRPEYGLADWLVEDLGDDGQTVFEGLTAASSLSRDGDIYVVPDHGRNPGEYVSKLGRVFMPKVSSDGTRTGWSERLSILIGQLETRRKPDVILLDSRAGFGEVASVCVTSLGETLVLLFAVGGAPTWSGYRILFDSWKRSGVTKEVRTKVQIVGAMVPDTGTKNFFERLRENGYDLFLPAYDEIPPGEAGDDLCTFEESDETAPHCPWPILRDRGFSSLRSLHSRLESVDSREVGLVFGPLLDGLNTALVKDPVQRTLGRTVGRNVG